MATKKKIAKSVSKSPAKRAAPAKGARPEELLFHAMYLMSVIDGSASEEELQVVEGLLTGVPEFGKSTVEKLVQASEELVVEHGGVIDSLVALTSLQKKDHRVKCFLLAAEVAYASGGIGPAESALLKTIAKTLRLDTDTTKSIIKVLGMKYRG